MIEPLGSSFQRLEQSRSEIEAQISGFTPAQLSFRQQDGAWTIAEVLDHVVRVERTVLEGARKPGVQRAAWRPRRFRRVVTWLVFRVGLRIKIPERVKQVRPQAGADPHEVRARWGFLRAEWREFLSTLTADQLGHLAIKHPIAGPFSYRDVLKFLEWHLRHHRRQIGRIAREAVTRPAAAGGSAQTPP